MFSIHVCKAWKLVHGLDQGTKTLTRGFRDGEPGCFILLRDSAGSRQPVFLSCPALTECEGLSRKQQDGGSYHRLLHGRKRDPKSKDRAWTGAAWRAASASIVRDLRAAEFAGRLEQFGLPKGKFVAHELGGTVRRAARIRNVCGEIFAKRNLTFILEQYHALEYAAAAVRILTPDKDRGRGGKVSRIS